MWGTHGESHGVPDSPRFIPTHVGNTRNSDTMLLRSPVHPHACGEHISFGSIVASSVGSSPRMWGTPAKLRAATLKRRFIPTHVGNTGLHLNNDSQVTVHPHACGEHPKTIKNITPKNGSSPRMWGTQHPRRERPLPDRFIPTHVGNTSMMIFLGCHISVHPHACGEHSSPYLQWQETSFLATLRGTGVPVVRHRSLGTHIHLLLIPVFGEKRD